MQNRTYKILVIDDEKIFREQLVGSLIDRSYKTDEANSKESAIASIKAHPTNYDFVLLDLTIPKNEGDKSTVSTAFETIEEIMNINPNIRVVIYTAKHLDRKTIFEAERKGAFRCIILKSGENLENLIQNLVDTVQLLNQIRQDIDEILNTRDWAKGLILAINAGISIIDSEYKIWYMNHKQLEIMSGIRPRYGYVCWCEFYNSNRQIKPCLRCAVKRALEGEEQAESIILSLIANQIRYFKVAATPLRINKGFEPFAALKIDIALEEDHPLLSVFSVEERMKLITDAIVTRGYDCAAIMIVTDEGRNLQKVAYSGYNEKDSNSNEPYTWEHDSCIRKVMEQRKPESFKRSKNIKDELGKSIGLPLFDQWALFPLIADNAVLGILRVDLDNKNELMQEKGFDFNEVKLYADEATRILSNMLPRKKRIKDIQKDLESSLKAIQKHGYDRVRLYGVSLDGTRLYGLKEVGGTPGRFESLEFFINTDRYSYDSCIVKKEPIIYHGDFGKCSWTDIIGENKEWIEIPILDENRLIGKLSIDNQNSKKLIQLESIKKIDYIIKSISGLLKQLGLPDIRDTSDRHAIIRLDQLDAVNTKIISASDREKSLNIIIEKIMEFSGATSAYIRFLEGNELRMGPGKGDVYTAVTNIISLDDPDSLSASAIRTKKPQIHPKANEDESLQKMHERQAINPDAIEILKQQKSIGCFPLEFAGEMQGVLAIHSKLRQEFFDENVNELLNLLGERAAILIRDERIARAAEEKEKKYHAELLRTRQLASIGQLAAAVAHEINNPLNFITVIAQDILIDLEEKGSYPIEKLRQDMTRVKEVIDWISYYIVAQLRDIAKDRPTKLEPADINVVIRDSFMLFRRQLDTWHIKVNLDGLLSVSPILADAGKLKQVFINLITNSRDALDKCEDGVIKVITYDTNDSVVISFSDNGAGITDKNITKIFDPFFSTKEYGVGLGLSIVKEIVESFNGVIKLENQLGEGTNFIIIFPK